MRSSLPALLALALALGLLGVVGAPGLFPPPEELRSFDAPVMSVKPSSAVLACPPGILDPFEPEEAANPGAIWATTGLGAGDEPLSQLVVKAPEGAHLELPSGFILAAQSGGELLGLSATGCSAPLTDQWIVLGSTQLGSDAVLVLSNPSPLPSKVTISAMGAAGPLAAQAQPLTVPAHSSLPVLPLGWFADEDNLVLRIQAEGAGVAAFAQLSALDGEVPQGTTWTSASTPTNSAMILGVGGEESATLRIAVPGEEPATVRAPILGAEEEKPLTEEEITVDAGTVLAIPLDGASAQEAALELESEQAMIVAVERTWKGGAFPTSTTPWRLLSTSLPSKPFTSAKIPGAETLGRLVASQMSMSTRRQTSVHTESGMESWTAKLIIALPQSAGAGSASIEVAGQRVELLEGRSTILDLPSADASISANTPIRAALLIEAVTPNGTVHASWPVGTAGLIAREAQVSVEP